MDINDLRSALTVVGLLLFLGLVVRVWDRRRRADFDEAAQLPFIDEDGGKAAAQGERRE